VAKVTLSESLSSTTELTGRFSYVPHDIHQNHVLGEGLFFIFPEYLVRPDLSLLIQKFRWEEDGQALCEVNHNARGQPF
jgi:hypothetical protein